MVRRFVATGGLGMKGVDTIARIRREHFVRGKSIKEIVRELHVSRNTVRKVLRTGATAFSYEREVQPLPRIGPWREALDRLLAGNEGKPARERLTLIRIFEELRNQGYEGSYDALRRYAKGWRRAQATMTAAAYVPLSFAPGEAYQFDWSHEIVLINGTTVSVRVAHVRLCHSRMLFVRAYPRETQEMVFDAHDRAFAFFKGCCTRGIYDNMKTAVDAIFVGQPHRAGAMGTPWARSGLIIAASCRCAATTWSIPLPAPRRPAGRRGRWRTRSGWCGNASSPPGSG